MKKTRVRIEVRGIVQGVGFRYHAQRKAMETGLQGFVRNTYDGSVIIEAEGSDDAIDRFCHWCRQGPPRAQVRHFRKEDIDLLHDEGFKILPTI